MDAMTTVTQAICLALICGPVIGLFTFIGYKSIPLLLRLSAALLLDALPENKEYPHEWK